VRLLAQREHSRVELYRKLQSRFADSDFIDLVLDSLEEQGYLSDERFTEEYLKSRKRKGYGPLRIRAELQERGISQELIACHLEEGDSEWYRLMQQAAASKLGSFAKDSKSQQKIARFLEYRGFPVSMIRRYLWDDA
jgi:regulatory protein